MKIRELQLNNFRGFKEQRIIFSEQFTVIAGVNGNGKTAILEALALLISRLLPQISPAKLGYRNFNVSDIHGNEDATGLIMKTICGGIPIQYSGSFEREIPYQSFPKLPAGLQKEIRNAYGIDKTRSTDAAPIAVYYTTDRAGFSLPRRLDGNTPSGQAAAYHRALVKKKVDYKDFMRWYRVVLKLNERSSDHPTAPRRLIETIEFVLHEFLNQFDSLRVEESPPRLLVKKGQHTLDLAQLSDGERSFLAMVIDLCKRLARANPGIKTLDGEGVVLIDELELHLHPTWQLEVLEKLRSTFPNLQFIVTTHSPFIVQTAREGEVVKLDGDLAVEPAGRTIEEVARLVMGVTNTNRSPRYQQMLETARLYLHVVDLAKGESQERKALLQRELIAMLAPFSDNPAYVAFLERKGLIPFEY